MRRASHENAPVPRRACAALVSAIFVTVATVATVAVPSIALAQNEARPASNASDAQGFFRRATTEYDAGHFAMAAALFRAAFEADRRNVAYLFNAARAAERAEDRAQSIMLYEWLLRELPESAADARRSVQESLTRLHGATPPPARQDPPQVPRVQPSPNPQPQPQPTPQPAQPQPRFSAGPFVLLGAGALSFASAGLFYSLQQGALSRCPPIGTGVVMCLEQDESSARAMNTGANISHGVGAALTVAGGVWLIVQATRRVERPTIAVIPTPSGVAVGGAF